MSGPSLTSIALALALVLASQGALLGWSDSSQESSAALFDSPNSRSPETASDPVSSTFAGAPAELTTENIYDHEEYWPNIVRVADDWEPPKGMPRRPQVLQGVLVRVEQNGTVRLDLARYGRADLPIGQTDLVERANAVARGEMFKHEGNLTLQIGNILVSSGSSVPGPQSSRPIKMASVLLFVFADPRAADFDRLAKRLAEFSARAPIVSIFIPQNVERGDLDFVHARLRASEWYVPFVYPERATVRTEVLLRKPPREPHLLLLTREGRILLDAPLGKEDVLERIREIAAPLQEDSRLQRVRNARGASPSHVAG